MAEEPEKTLGQRIRAKREELDWSQEKLAEKIGVSSLSILRWELDRSFPRGDEIQLSLVKVLNLSKNEFTKKRKKSPAQKKEGAPPIQEARDEQEISPVEEVKKRAGGSAPMEEAEKREEGVPIEMVLPNQYWQVPIPSAEEIGDTGTVEYKIPPVIMYRGFYEQVYHKKYGYAEERRVTSNGKRLLPYDTWVNPETVIYGWGHTGSGPRHLAESILLDYFEVMYPNEQEKTLRSWVNKYSFNFMMDFTAWFDKREWGVWSGAITAWLQEQRENADPAPSPSLSDIDDGWTGWWERWEKYKGT